MQNNSVYKALKMPVDNVLEIRLSYKMWNRVKYAAIMKNRSYSWIVRYAVFRMIKRVNVENYVKSGKSIRNDKGLEQKFEKINKIVLTDRADSTNKHRHRLCLYGKDELLIRLCAARLKCSMTHMVRLALVYHLDELLRQIGFLGRSNQKGIHFGRVAWFWLGIKIFKGVEFPNIGIGHQYFKFTQFQKSDYW